MIIINTKNYRTGEDLLRLARQIENSRISAALAVPIADIQNIKEKTKLAVYAQHIDPINSEKSTGHVSVESIKSHGASGSLLNHSEHQLSFGEIKLAIKQLKSNKLISIVCVKSLAQAKQVIPLKPSAIAFEDPKLISTGKSITKYNLRALHGFIGLLKGKKIIPICGAGISSIEDIKSASAMGCPSVLIASAIAAAKDPSHLLKDIHDWQKQ